MVRDDRQERDKAWRASRGGESTHPGLVETEVSVLDGRDVVLGVDGQELGLEGQEFSLVRSRFVITVMFSPAMISSFLNS